MRTAVLIFFLVVSPELFAEWADDYPVGSAFLDVSAKDQTNHEWTNADLIGRNGLIIFVNRSTTW